MSSHGNGSPAVYSVVMSAATKSEIKNLFSQALQQSAGHTFLAAFRSIVSRLQKDPLVFGEPQ
jgi:hypothetical protein